MHQPKAIWVIGLTAFWNRTYMYVRACLSSVTNQCTYTVGRKIIHASHSVCKKIYSRKSSREINPRFLFRPMQLWAEIFLRNRSYFYSLWCFIAITFCFLRIFSFFSTMQFKLNLHEARDYFWKRLCIYVPHVSRLCATISCTFQSSNVACSNEIEFSPPDRKRGSRLTNHYTVVVASSKRYLGLLPFFNQIHELFDTNSESNWGF